MRLDSQRLPDFLCVGPPKTATTFLDRVLKSHPQIYLPESKELHFFSFFYSKDIENYCSFFKNADDGLVAGEISPSYFYHDEAARRIRETLDKPKIIITLRNPVELVYSLYWQIKRHNFYQSKDNDIDIGFEDALKKYPHRLYKPAMFSTHIKRWFELFERDDVMIIYHDEIKSDLNATLVRLFNFLGVDSDGQVIDALNSQKVILSGVSPRSSLVAKLYGIVYVVLNRCVFMPMKLIIGYKNALWLKDFLHIRQLLGVLFFKNGYPALTNNQRAILLEKFLPEIEELEQLLHKDLSAWKRLDI